MKREITERNVQIKPDSGIDISKYSAPKGISEKEKYTDLIIEMKEAIEWYMDNCRTINEGRSYDETFYNLGANLISQAEYFLVKEDFDISTTFSPKEYKIKVNIKNIENWTPKITIE